MEDMNKKKELVFRDMTHSLELKRGNLQREKDLEQEEYRRQIRI